MDKEFFEKKIRELSEESLLDLFKKMNSESDPALVALVKEVIVSRGLKVELKSNFNRRPIQIDPTEIEKLKFWNWGAFLMGPIWTLSNRLGTWSIFQFIPIVNIVIAFYMGYNGNKLAFEKSKNISMDDFVKIQKNWSLWGVRLFWIGVILGIIFSF